MCRFPNDSCNLIKKKDLIDLGLFDEDLFIYYPDCEIGRRINNNKKSVIQIFDTKAKHNMATLKIKNKLLLHFLNNLNYIKRKISSYIRIT